MKNWLPLLAGLLTISVGTQAQQKPSLSLTAGQAQTASGPLQGASLPSGIHVFKGVPYAAPPVGSLRWQAPQPVKPWATPRPATEFGPRAMQLPLFSDMQFRSNGVSEDCLYLNVWTGAQTAQERRPVLVYFYGGGFLAGDGSEPRYDGESLARRGIVTVTVNYRLGVFGFLAHPELTKESPHHAAGNYGLLDQAAALQWVRANIAAFGGDPHRVTIGGESAGSFSVSAQLASPLAQHLVAGAIGESGSLLSLQPLATLPQAEQEGVAFAAAVDAGSLAALRALPAQQLLEAAGKPGAVRFRPVVDGYFLPQQPAALYQAGRQAHVPLLVGWNSQESGPQGILAQAALTVENYRAAVQKLYPDHAADVLRLYPAATDADVAPAATDLASDRFIGYSTWKWADAHAHTSGRPVYRYLYARPRPALAATPTVPPADQGAVHSAEIEYALGNLAANKVYAWMPDDYRLSEQLQTYFANFIKTSNPNGAGLPNWPPLLPDGSGQTLRLDATTRLVPGPDRARYLKLGELAK
ncbi:MAG: carboxylesterase/lipase family protein [Janthinobacterium lividum]